MEEGSYGLEIVKKKKALAKLRRACSVLDISGKPCRCVGRVAKANRYFQHDRMILGYFAGNLNCKKKRNPFIQSKINGKFFNAH